MLIDLCLPHNKGVLFVEELFNCFSFFFAFFIEKTLSSFELLAPNRIQTLPFQSKDVVIFRQFLTRHTAVPRATTFLSRGFNLCFSTICQLPVANETKFDQIGLVRLIWQKRLIAHTIADQVCAFGIRCVMTKIHFWQQFTTVVVQNRELNPMRMIFYPQSISSSILYLKRVLFI